MLTDVSVAHLAPQAEPAEVCRSMAPRVKSMGRQSSGEDECRRWRRRPGLGRLHRGGRCSWFLGDAGRRRSRAGNSPGRGRSRCAGTFQAQHSVIPFLPCLFALNRHLGAHPEMTGTAELGANNFVDSFFDRTKPCRDIAPWRRVLRPGAMSRPGFARSRKESMKSFCAQLCGAGHFGGCAPEITVREQTSMGGMV